MVGKAEAIISFSLSHCGCRYRVDVLLVLEVIEPGVWEAVEREGSVV